MSIKHAIKMEVSCHKGLTVMCYQNFCNLYMNYYYKKVGNNSNLGQNCGLNCQMDLYVYNIA